MTWELKLVNIAPLLRKITQCLLNNANDSLGSPTRASFYSKVIAQIAGAGGSSWSQLFPETVLS